MANTKVEVNGSVLPDVVDISYGKDSGDTIGTAELTVANTPSNRAMISSGDTVDIFESTSDGFDKKWSGEVITKPSNASRRGLTLELEVESTAAQLEYAKVNRPFIELSTGDMIRQAVEKIRDPSVSEVFAYEGTTVSGWNGNAPDLSLIGDDAGVISRGDDGLYAGLPESGTGEYAVEYTDLTSDAVPGRRIEKVETRLLINDTGGMFDGVVILVDDDGIRYEWDLDLVGAQEFKTYELAVEDADVTSGAGDKRIRFEFTTDGTIPEERAFAIDYIKTVPFDLIDREIGVTTNISDTDFVTTRRVDGSVLKMVDNFATEDGATAYVDKENVLNYLSDGDTSADVGISYYDPSLNVVDVSVDRDFDVRNRVTVQGKDGIQASYEDTGSIQFYNTEAPKEEPINDPSLRTREQLRRRARGFLNDKAWDDGALSFTIGNSEFLDVEPGQVMPVDWPPEDISGIFQVGSVNRTASGYANVSLSGNLTI